MVRDEKEYHLEEWKVAMENARHFNDLLIRFRMLGLPMVITLFIAGIAAAHLADDIELWKWAIPIASALISLVLLIAVLWRPIKMLPMWITNHIKKNEHKSGNINLLAVSFWEFLLWIIFTLIITGYSVVSLYTLVSHGESLEFSNVAYFSLTPLAIIAAVVLLVALYTMDRFYSYDLLIGAVVRLSRIEKDLNYQITDKTSEVVPQKRATILITFFYGLPGLLLLTAYCIGCI